MFYGFIFTKEEGGIISYAPDIWYQIVKSSNGSMQI